MLLDNEKTSMKILNLLTEWLSKKLYPPLEKEKVLKSNPIKWTMRKDLPQMISIEGFCFEFPWDEQIFVEYLRKRNIIGMCYKDNEIVKGFIIYCLQKNHLEILSLAVHPNYQRQGIGKALLDKIVSKIDGERRRFISLNIRETNMGGLKFFAKYGFKAVELVRDFYDDTSEDSIVMELRNEVQNRAKSLVS